MVKSQGDIVSFLMKRGLVSARSVVKGGLTIVNASRRNLNFKVMQEDGPSYLIKCATTDDAAHTLAREAAAYVRFQAPPLQSKLAAYLPRYYGYDAAEQTLILELVPCASNLREHHERTKRFSMRVSRAVGTALASFHRLIGPDDANISPSAQEPVQSAWALSLHRLHHGALTGMSGVGIQLVKIIQQFPEFCTLIDQSRSGWQKAALIHGDIKWENLIISTQEQPSIKLVDWELAGLGDPCWDVGSVFHDYLSFWISGIPITGSITPDRFMDLSCYPLQRMQSAMCAFWRSYARQMGLSGAKARDWFLRALRYAGARLIQLSYEYAQTSPALTGNMVYLLQLGWNILERPDEAAVYLIGMQSGEDEAV